MDNKLRRIGAVNTRVLSAVLLLMVVASSIIVYFRQQVDSIENKPLSSEQTKLLITPKPLRKFHLTDNEGRPFSLVDFQGQWSLVFFGFIGCGEDCPKLLDNLNELYKAIHSLHLRAPQIVMISIDPAHDTPEQLNNYIKSFNDEFIAATGSEAELDKLAQDLSILYFKIRNRQGDVAREQISIQDKGTVMLINPRGQLRAVFASPLDLQGLLHDYQTITSSHAAVDSVKQS